MAAISRRGQGGHIYNNTRARVLLRRMCVKPAALTTHSPPKVFAYPPAQRHALPEHFRSPTQPRRTPAGCAMPSPPTSQPIPRRSSPLAPSIFSRPSRALLITHAAPTHAPEHFRSPAPRRCIPRRPHNPFPAEALRSPPHSDTPFPSTSAPPRSPDARRQAARCTPRRPHNTFPAEDFFSPPQPRRPPAGCAMHSSPTSQHILRRKPAPAPAQRHALPEHFLTPSPPRRTPAGCAMHARRPHNTFPVEDLLPPPHSDTLFPSTSARPRSPDARPQAARCTPRSPHNPFPAAPRSLPFRSASGTKKRHRTMHVRCRMSRSTVVAVGRLGW